MATPATNGPGPVASFRAAASALFERQRFAREYGLSFDGKRDLYTALGYKDELTIKDYRSRYRRGDIAKTIVEFWPRAAWQEGADIFDDEDPDVTTSFELAVTTLFNDLDVWSKLLRADILAGLGQYSCLLIGVTGNSDLSTELPRGTGIESIIYLRPYAEDRCKVDKIVGERQEESADPRFGLPLTYKLKLGDKGLLGTERDVHWSRIIHVVDGNIEDEIYGCPRLEVVWNRLYDIDKLVGGGSEAAWKRMDPGTMFDMDPEAFAKLSEAELTAFKQEIEDFYHGISRYALTAGVTPKSQAVSVATFGPNVESVVSLVSSATRIAQRILLGSERGELSSTEDRKNVYDNIVSRRQWFAVPLLGQLIDRLVDYGYLPEPIDSTYTVEWPEIDELTEDEKAEVAGKLASANKAQVEAGGELITLSAEIRDTVLGLPPMDDVSDGNDNNGSNDTEGDNLKSAESSPRRIIIVGGPRRGKSTLARSFREQGIPTYCGDPQSKVKDVEPNVNYLPENLDWSASSEYVATEWLTKPGPWCVEGHVTARAIRKLVKSSGASTLDGIEIMVLSNVQPGVNTTVEQEALAKGVNTVWNGIKGLFPNAKYVDDGHKLEASSSVSNHRQQYRVTRKSPVVKPVFRRL